MSSHPDKRQESLLYLKSLREDGVEDLYLENRPADKAASAQSVKPPPAGESKNTGEDLKGQILTLRETVLRCSQCAELAPTRNSVVFGAGNIRAELVFVGEAPGRDEDEQGLPFVGRAGQLLTKIIEAIGYQRQQVFICNVLKCRPPKNRPPKPDEIMNCQPYLKQQLALIRPRMICALGNFAAQTLLGTQEPMARMRGKFHEYEGIPVLCTYHPAYLLRNPAEKRKVWDDLKLMRAEIDRLKSQ